MTVISGLSVANLYYNQPLLEAMRETFNTTELQANMITFITQAGYALGLVFVVPLADKISRRSIIITNMVIAALACIVIAFSTNLLEVWIASLILGCNSVAPQIFIPVANRFSKPTDKPRNMGIVLSGLLGGILGARVISGYIGDIAEWRMMFRIAAAIMVVCLIVSVRTLPIMRPSFKGTYSKLMHSVVHIYKEHSLIRFYAVRGGFGFGSMMAIWSCMAFHLTSSPFYTGSGKVGMLGLCGLAGATAASGIGKYLPKLGIERFCIVGTVCQLLAWMIAYILGNTYVGLIAAIILVDIGAQCHQLSNQSGCLSLVPEASNRANTIFMSHLFAGGSLGTLFAGFAWEQSGWNGVCAIGWGFALANIAVTYIIRKKGSSETAS